MAGAECNGCGACCDPVALPVSPAELVDGAADRAYGRAETAWMREHLRPLPRREIPERVPWFKGGGWSAGLYRGEPFAMAAFIYECDRFDRVTRQCSDYDNRPKMCREYPWYGSRPDPDKALPPMCAYLAEVGKPVAEIPVEWRQ